MAAGDLIALLMTESQDDTQSPTYDFDLTLPQKDPPTKGGPLPVNDLSVDYVDGFEKLVAQIRKDGAYLEVAYLWFMENVFKNTSYHNATVVSIKLQPPGIEGTVIGQLPDAQVGLGNPASLHIGEIVLPFSPIKHFVYLRLRSEDVQDHEIGLIPNQATLFQGVIYVKDIPFDIIDNGQYLLGTPPDSPNSSVAKKIHAKYRTWLMKHNITTEKFSNNIASNCCSIIALVEGFLDMGMLHESGCGDLPDKEEPKASQDPTQDPDHDPSQLTQVQANNRPPGFRPPQRISATFMDALRVVPLIKQRIERWRQHPPPETGMRCVLLARAPRMAAPLRSGPNSNEESVPLSREHHTGGHVLALLQGATLENTITYVEQWGGAAHRGVQCCAHRFGRDRRTSLHDEEKPRRREGTDEIQPDAHPGWLPRRVQNWCARGRGVCLGG